MKSFRVYVTTGIILLVSVFSNLDSSLAGTLNANLSPNGELVLDADFTGDFECVPEGLTPWTSIVEFIGCTSVSTPGWTAHLERQYGCAVGHTWEYIATATGGRYVNGNCGSFSEQVIRYVVEDKMEAEITAPEGRIPKAVVNIDVGYDFKYDQADTCSGSIPNRMVSVYYAGSPHTNLPVSGTETFSYNFSASSGTIMLHANACCGGTCTNAYKFVYVDPDDLGGPTCSEGGSTFAGYPVNVANGNVFVNQTDFSLSGVMPINFTRYYNSKSSPLGFTTRWSHTFDTKAVEWGNAIRIINADGSIFYYMDNDGDNVYLPELPKGLKSRVIKNPDGSLKREFYDGASEEFNTVGSTGYLMAIVDRNGNRITLTRDSGNRLIKITDPANREINITYNTSNYIEQITLPDETVPGGKILGYTYTSGMLQKVTYPDGTYRTYEYSGYNLTGIKDENGNYIEKHTYDYQGRGTTSSIDGTKEKLTISYLSDSQSTVTNSLGRVSTYTIDKTGGRSHTTSLSGPGCVSCGQGDTSYTYDDDLNITSKTDPNGNVTIITYDNNGNMLTKTEAYGTADERTTIYTYNDFGQILTGTLDGITTEYTYDDYGNMLTKKEALGSVDEATTTFTYYGPELYRQLHTVEDPNGNFTEYYYSYDGTGYTKTEFRYLDNTTLTTTYRYNLMGNPVSMTDADGNTTTYEYNLRDRLNKEIRPDGGTTKYEYDSLGNRTKIIDVVDENEERTLYMYEYDVNRLTKITDFGGNTTNYAYDTEGNMISMTIKDIAGNVKTSDTYTYEDHNRLEKTIHPDDTYTEQTYDPVGNIRTRRDENVNITTFEYDALNRLKTVINPDNLGSTSYTYDKRDNLKTVTDANGNVTTYSYDDLNRLSSTVSPDTGTTTYTYDDNGNMLTRTDANGIMTTYTYDELGRQTSVQFPDSMQDINYFYDDPDAQNGEGRLTEMTDPSGYTWYDYDAMGRVIKETKKINNILYRTEYTYDRNGNILTITYPGGRVITYTYNELGKVTSVSDTYLGVTRPLASDITYQPFGDMESFTYGDTLQRTIGHDNRYRIDSITTGSVQDISYDYFDNGNVHDITDNLNPSKNKSYTYDPLNRLTIANGQWGAITYAHDDVGNRTYETTDTGSTTYTYTPNTNKLASASGEKTFSFGYDNDGNTTSENTRQYIYNQNQRLTQVTDTGTVLGEYIYNGKGQRAEKWIPSQNKCTIFHYDQNGLLIAESSSAGNIRAEYVYLNGQPLAKIENNNVYYYHNDHLGTPMLMTDSSGNTVWQGEFKPFGEPVSVSGSITNNLRFPGQYFDSETGLHQNWFRDYRPETGRYVEADVSGVMRGTNHLYFYAKNNPSIYVDPMGLLCEVVKTDTKKWCDDHEEVIYGDWIYDHYIQFNIKCWCIFYRDKRIDVTRTWYTQTVTLLKCSDTDKCGGKHTYYKTESKLDSNIQNFSKYGGRDYKKIIGTMYSQPGKEKSGGSCDCMPFAPPPPGLYQQ